MRHTKEELDIEGQRQIEKAKFWLIVICWVVIALITEQY